MDNTGKSLKQHRKNVIVQFAPDKGRALASSYDQSQSKYPRDVYDNIQGKERRLTDLGARHISNVLDNLICLFSDDAVIRNPRGIERSFLGMLVLFHDTGNIYGRTGHHKRIGRIFDRIGGTSANIQHEKAPFSRAIRAHTWTLRESTPDMPKELPSEDHLEGHRLRRQGLASILCFADELAVEVQRTSKFKREQHLYDCRTRIHRDHVSATNVYIDRKGEGIVLTYYIPIDRLGNNGEEPRPRLIMFSRYTYRIIVKGDDKQSYVVFYTHMLKPLKMTEIKFNFQCDNEIPKIDFLPIQLMTDEIVPRETCQGLEDLDLSYRIKTLVDNLISIY